MTKSKLGERLKQARLERGWSLDFVAGRVQRSARTIRRYEGGDTEPPIDLLAVFAGLYGVTTDHLIHGDPVSSA